MTIDFKHLARLMLQGWCDRANDSEDHSDEHYFAKLVENDHKANMLMLFSHWSNDLLSVFAEDPTIRLTNEFDDNGQWVVRDVPEPVMEEGKDPKNYYWQMSELIGLGHYQPGSWQYYDEPAEMADA